MDRRHRQHNMTTTAALWVALAVLLLAAVLRLYNITEQSIWFDEAFAWNIIIQDDMFPRISTDTHPPLYYIVLRGWAALAGDSPLALRYLSALVGLMSVALVYQIGRELAIGRRGWAGLAALAALMMALSDAEIFLAQEARNYTLYTFFACLSMWLYLRYVRRGGVWYGLLWAAANSALVYTHYQGLFIPAIQGLHALLFLRDGRRRGAVLWLALSGVPLLPWLVLVTIPQAQNAIDNSLPFAIPTNWEIFRHLGARYLGEIWSLLGVLMLWGGWSLVVRRTRRGAGDASLLALWVLLPFGVLFFGNLFAPLLTERKLLIIAPAIALLIAVGLTALSPSARRLLVAAILLYSLTTVDYYRLKEPWDAIAAPALELGRAGDLYLAQVEVGQYPMKYYWERNLPEGAVFATFPFLGDPTLAPTTDHPTFYQGYLRQTLLDHNRERTAGTVRTAWVVFWSRDDAVLDVLASEGYRRTMTITTDHIGNAIDLYRYDYLTAPALVSYENGLILRALEIDADAMRIDLWWEAEATPQADYTTSAALLDADGRLVAQWDSPPPRPTSAISAGDLVYDPKRLQISDETLDALPAGDYRVVVAVYLWTPDGIREIATEDGDIRFAAGVLTIRD
ncbi:MAG: hypothetical protein EA396_10170 [Anaerolineaceae bacterium]|nr:MAG: hypothetical protein EA396_10170 [Anaerolineaceae bacterium]